MSALPDDCYEDEWLDDKGRLWRTCWQCGGNGYIEGECTCMDDTCCCLEPDEPACDICKGHGAFVIDTSPPSSAVFPDNL